MSTIPGIPFKMEDVLPHRSIGLFDTMPGKRAWSFVMQIEATYENGILRLDKPLPLRENERVVVTIQARVSHARSSYGLVKWQGDVDELDELLSADNQPWAVQE